MTILVTLVLVATVCFGVPAYGYDEVGSGRSCIDCHGAGTESEITAPVEPSGPHGGYTTTSNKCATCHTVHAAPADSVLLLPAETVKDTCMTCHDGTITDGEGVYGAIEAHTGSVPVANHSIDSTLTVPGGDGTSGGGDSEDRLFSGEYGFLTCSDCHSPHATDTVAAFTGDRARSEDTDPANPVTETTAIQSNRLLKQRPTSMDPGAPALAVYGSDWCGVCHTGRLNRTGIHNHPVESADNYPDSEPMYHYDLIARAGHTTILGTLGANNYGYVMPDKVTPGQPRMDEQQGHSPICQQCHEDARHVGDVTQFVVDGSEAFTVTGPDGTVDTDNPQFETFPHESQNDRFLLELGTDLCTNCHKPE